MKSPGYVIVRIAGFGCRLDAGEGRRAAKTWNHDMAELELNRDTIQFIIDKAHEFHAREDVTFPDEPEAVDEEWVKQVATDFGEDPYYQELKSTIEDLEPDQQVSLVSLMWVGRGDYSLDEWDEAIEYAEPQCQGGKQSRDPCFIPGFHRNQRNARAQQQFEIMTIVRHRRLSSSMVVSTKLLRRVG